ncbi:peptidoglycan-recognition protein 2-like [Macrosteles quadrilineatus]|uniref:peptidoglycan-recognition protein 2-like n=1 Tax=Macrosteles quadrilineatus TaxID=74068 RepID=UPI0023E2A6FF|nr:peptidoglycan-recognition protein 2-like [Macrosteles quadrilineatus]
MDKVNSTVKSKATTNDEKKKNISIEDIYKIDQLDLALRPQTAKFTLPDAVPRREWRARFSSGAGSVEPLNFPLNQVIITHTDSDPCGDKSSCTRALRGVQELFMMMGYHDIPYNFMVTTEGDVFEGRAWLDECPIPESLGRQDKTLVIGIIAKESDCFGKAKEAINTQVDRIIDHGLKYELIHPNFLKRESHSCA